MRLQVPCADVGIDAGAALLAVGAEAEHLDFAAHARVEIDVRPAPRILWQLLEIAARLPVRRQRRQLRFCDERGEPLLAGRVTNFFFK